jgi:hypothetical protein
MSELYRYAHISQMFLVGSTLQEYWKSYTFSVPVRIPTLIADDINDVGWN